MGTFDEVCHQRLCGTVSVNKIVCFGLWRSTRGTFSELDVLK